MAQNPLPNYYQPPNAYSYTDPVIQHSHFQQQPLDPQQQQQHQYFIQQPAAIPHYQTVPVGQQQAPPPLAYRSHSAQLPISPYTPSNPHPQPPLQAQSAPFHQNSFPNSPPKALPQPPTAPSILPTNPYPSPTSPYEHVSPSRRPLPQPQSMNRAASVSPSMPSAQSSRRPLPSFNGTQPLPPVSPLQRPATAAPITSSVQANISRFNTMASSPNPSATGHSPRPLPTPGMRSPQNPDLAQSPVPPTALPPQPQQPLQPSFSRHEPDPAPPLQPGQKFVPMWKRSLPSPLVSAGGASQAPSMERRGTVAGYVPLANRQTSAVSGVSNYTNGTPATVERSKTTVRPLPFPGGDAKPTEIRALPPSKRASEMPLQKVPAEVTNHRRGNSMEVQSSSSSNANANQRPPLPGPAHSFHLRDYSRSRTLPAQAPPPTDPLPSRPISMMKSSKSSSTAPPPPPPISESPESLSDSDGESISNNALLSRRSPVRLPSEVPESPGRQRMGMGMGMGTRTRTPSPEYGIRDIPFRAKQVLDRGRDTSPNRITLTRPKVSGTSSTSPSTSPSKFATSPPRVTTLPNPPKPTQSQSQSQPQSQSSGFRSTEPPTQSNIMRLAQMSLEEEKSHFSSPSGGGGASSSSSGSRGRSSPSKVPSSSQPQAQTQTQTHPLPSMSRSLAQSGSSSTSTSTHAWPSDLPRLPRAPGTLPQPPSQQPLPSSSASRNSSSPSRSPVPPPLPPRKQNASSPGPGPASSSFRNTTPRQGATIPNLDDAPPPSLRRSPSPIMQSQPMGRPPSYSRNPPPINTTSAINTRASPQRFSQPLPVVSPTRSNPLPSPTRPRQLPPVSPTRSHPLPKPGPLVQPSVVGRALPSSSRGEDSYDQNCNHNHNHSHNHINNGFNNGSSGSNGSNGVNVNMNMNADPNSSSSSGMNGRQPIPKISFPASADDSDSDDSLYATPDVSIVGPDHPPPPQIAINGFREDNSDVPELPSISIGEPLQSQSPNAGMTPQFSMSVSSPSPSSGFGSGSGRPTSSNGPLSPSSSSAASSTSRPHKLPMHPALRGRGGLVCGGCGGTLLGRVVNAMGARWHPGCFRCCICNELLENLSSYEHEGRPYCHLDYHEQFAPRCYHCQTAIVDEVFITLDDPELGKRTYHEQHFFCAECGDPFLPPGSGNRSFAGDGTFKGGDDDVGFTVYGGHPYCEACHVRLRMPKCKRCKRSIRDGMQAVEALGGKWCWECFTCATCDKPFENPSFFQREDKAYCERCFSIMIRNEI